MAVQMVCPQCNKTQEPYINPKTEEVFCGSCNGKIDKINHFIKMQLKALKQYREVKKVPFSAKCQKCGKEDRPVDNGTDIVCKSCNQPMDHLTETFKRMLKTQLKKVDKDV